MFDDFKVAQPNSYVEGGGAFGVDAVDVNTMLN